MNGDDVRRARNALNLTQEQLAARLGVTRQAVYLWEKGKGIRHPEILRRALNDLVRETTLNEEPRELLKGGGDG